MSTAAAPAQAWYKSFNRDHWFVFIVATLAWMFDCMDQQFFNLARDGAMEDLVGKATATIKAPYTTSVFLLGWATGGLILGSLGDLYGRAKVLTYAILLYSVCTGLSCLATGLFDFCLYRFLTGIGVGGVFGLAVALVADSVPDHTRAPALGTLQIASVIGNLSAGLIGMAIGWAAALPFGLKPWQMMFLVGAMPALLCVVVMSKLKEPQRWLDAKAAGKKLGIKFGSYGSLLGHPRWSKNAWLALAGCSAGIIGLWGIGNFHPIITRSIIGEHLKSANLSAADLAKAKVFWSSAGLLLQNIGGFFGMYLLAKIAEHKGRKLAFALSLIFSFGSTILVFWGMRSYGDLWMLAVMGFGQLSVFAVYAIYLPELFPTSLRSTGTSFCYNVGRIVAATAPFTLSKITASFGGDLDAFRKGGLYVSGVLLLGLLVVPFLPETKGQPLPEE